MKLNFHPFRDTLSVGLGLMTGGAGLVGTGAKKAFIREGDGLGKRFMVGLGATFFTGGAGLLPYLAAKPGASSQADVHSARGQAVDDRY